MNVKVPSFPSTFIPWFENQGYLAFLKLPGILADLGIGYLIYKYFEKQKDKPSIFYSSLYLLNPVSWYLSAMWGQIESVVFFFVLLGILKIIEGKTVKGLISYYLSLLFKVTSVVGLPVVVIHFFKSKNNIIRNIIVGTTLILVITFLVSYIFIDRNYLIWFFNTYVYRLIPGPTTLPFISVNAFNLWTLIFGKNLLNDSTILLGLKIKFIAYIVSSAVFSGILYKYYKIGKIFWAMTLMFFAAFLFLPRMHERYLFPIFVFMPFLVSKSKIILKYFYILSFLFLINLYNLWWVPRVDLLVNILNYDFVIRLLSLVNVVMFIVLLLKYLEIKSTKWDFK